MNPKHVAGYIFHVFLIAAGLWFTVALLRLGRLVSVAFAVVMVTIIALPLSRYPKFTLRLRVFSIIVLIVFIRVALGYQL